MRRSVEELAGNVVGTGIVPKAKTGNPAIDKIIEAEWQFFADPGLELGMGARG